MTGENIYFFKDVTWFQIRADLALQSKAIVSIKGSEGVPKTDAVISAEGLICVWDATYTKHPHAFHLYTSDGPAFIFRATDGLCVI